MIQLTQALSIKTGESRTASLMIGIMLFTAMGAAVGGIGIEALFFARFGVEYLPYMFLGLGITSMIVSFGITAALGSIPRRMLYLAIPLAITGILVTARLALLAGWNWLYPAMWLGKEILNSLNGILIWGVAGVLFDTRQAKRLFPLFNASRILGQVIGGFATGLLVLLIDLENLLLIWAGTLVLVFLITRVLLQERTIGTARATGRHRQPSLIQEMQRGYQYVRRSTLMRWISLAAILFSLLYFSLALPFSRAATAYYPTEESLAAFLGLFNGFGTAAAFLTSLLLANRLFARFGVMLCILVFPVIYLAGFASLALLPIFAVVVAFRFMQTIWLSGIADPAWQAMFNVVPPERRDQVRAFIDGVPEQAGTFIAGAILIVGEQTLAPQQLYIVGLLAAGLCTFAVHRARRGYNEALIDALRMGNPHLFYSDEQPFGGFRQDAFAIRTALDGLNDRDPAIRRVAAEILGHLSLPEAEAALTYRLNDSDTLVRAYSLRALAQLNATSALGRVAASLRDPEPEVRFEALHAISTLTKGSVEFVYQVSPLLDDKDSRVSTRAASVLLRIPPPFGGRSSDQRMLERARSFLRYTAAMGDLSDREYAILAMGEWGDAEAFAFLINELEDRGLPLRIRRAVLAALKRIDPKRAIPPLVDALGHPDRSLQDHAAALLGQIGEGALQPVLVALQTSTQEEGALLALQQLPTPPQPLLENYARERVTRAVAYDALRRGLSSYSSNEAVMLLTDSLDKKANQYAIRALRAIGLLGDQRSMELAINILELRSTAQRANVIEALESLHARWRTIIQPLTRMWEQEAAREAKPDWARLLNEEDPWIRDCAAFAAHSLGEMNMENIATLSLMERILFLKRVPLFANLSPADIKQVAALAQEESFGDGTVIAHEGEVGDVMFILVSGEVRVTSIRNGKEVELARRRAGEYVGEMALISKEPRIATLTTAGNVRALCIDQTSFEALLRDRPDVSLAVIQILCERLKEASTRLHQPAESL